MVKTYLKNNLLFAGIDDTEIAQLIEKIQVQILRFEKQELIVSYNTECNYLLLVCEGNVRGDMINTKGKTLKVEDIQAGKPLAPAFLFGKENKFPVSIIANTSAVVCRLWKNDVMKLMQLNAVFLTNYLNMISNRAQFLSQKVRFISFNTIKEKITLYLINQLKPDQISFEISVSQRELADLFGVSRPALARVISEMEAEGLIKVNGKIYTVPDKNKLRDF